MSPAPGCPDPCLPPAGSLGPAPGDALSVDDVVVVAADPPVDEIFLTGEQWRVVAAIGGGGRLGPLLRRLADDGLDARRLVQGLVEEGLLEVADPLAPLGGEEDRDDRGQALAASGPAETVLPVLVVRPAKPSPRTADAGLSARLAFLAEQFDALYEAASATALADDDPPDDRGGLLARIRHRHGR